MDDYLKTISAIAKAFDEVTVMTTQFPRQCHKFSWREDWGVLVVEYKYEMALLATITLSAAVTMHNVTNRAQHHVSDVHLQVAKAQDQVQMNATRLYWLGWYNNQYKFSGRTLASYSNLNSVLEQALKLQTELLRRVRLGGNIEHV